MAAVGGKGIDMLRQAQSRVFKGKGKPQATSLLSPLVAKPQGIAISFFRQFVFDHPEIEKFLHLRQPTVYVEAEDRKQAWCRCFRWESL